MSKITINATGLTPEEEKEILDCVRKMRRRRKYRNSDSIEYEARINDKKYVSHDRWHRTQ